MNADNADSEKTKTRALGLPLPASVGHWTLTWSLDFDFTTQPGCNFASVFLATSSRARQAKAERVQLVEASLISLTLLR